MLVHKSKWLINRKQMKINIGTRRVVITSGCATNLVHASHVACAATCIYILKLGIRTYLAYDRVTGDVLI